LTQFFRDELLKISEKLGDKNRSSQEDGPAKCDLVVFALIGVLFSTSDHYHIVSTSATLLAAQYLSQNMLETTRDVSCGLYLCSVLLSYQRISKRFIPEVPVFLLRVIYGFFRHLADTVPVADVFLGERLAALPQLSQGLLDEVELSALSLTLLDETRQNDMSGIEELGQQLFLCAVDTISRLATLWNEKSAFIEVFTPFSTALAAIHTTNSHVQSARDKLERLLKFARQERRPLTLQSHRPVAIPSYAPKFEENYSLDRKSYDPDKDRQEIKKLKAQVKKERKATLRDIRRDTAFIAREKISTRREQDKQYHEKLARLERTIATEEGAEKNAYEREKKARKRANRK
jgi:nucleolar protein 14